MYALLNSVIKYVDAIGVVMRLKKPLQIYCQPHLHVVQLFITAEALIPSADRDKESFFYQALTAPFQGG